MNDGKTQPDTSRTLFHKLKRCFLAVFFVLTLSLGLFYLESSIQLRQNYVFDAFDLRRVTKYLQSADPTNAGGPKYLVDSGKCKIPNLEPFNDELRHLYNPSQYYSCSDKPLLTYTKVIDNKAVLQVNQSCISKYTDDGVKCCYSAISRVKSRKNPDGTIKYSKCLEFTKNVTLQEDAVYVDCKDDRTDKSIYKNVHATITIKDDLKEKLEIFLNDSTFSSHLSVLCVGVDSVSRLNFMRLLKSTEYYVKSRDWIELKGYNKIGDNTFPNLMALLSGLNESVAYKRCNPRQVGMLDKCGLVLYDLRDLGYVTAYAEDEASINTFNYHKKGFENPPTDYYFRPYFLAAEEKLKVRRVDEMKYCTGPESSGERVLELARTFAQTFARVPYFGFFWMNSFSHNVLNSVSRMDWKLRDFFDGLDKSGSLNNTVVLFFSDHGMRFGDIRQTHTGWLEERLPMFFASFPSWFKDYYPEKYANFKANADRLSTPYDVYTTLQDIPVLSGIDYASVPSRSCLGATSLFEPINPERSCEDACIDQHWCTCVGYQPISTQNSTVLLAANHVLDGVLKILDSRSSRKCARYKLDTIMSASISETISYKNDVYILLIIKTKPRAIFEATVGVLKSNNTTRFTLNGSISRLDRYSDHSGCVHDSYLAKYCHCV